MDSTRRTVWGLTELYRWIIKSQLDGYIARYHTFLLSQNIPLGGS
jgi:hypothetical protein